MKTPFVYVVMAVVFAVLIVIYATGNNHISDEIAHISDESVEVTNPKLVVNFPVNLEFKRPAPLGVTRFPLVNFSHFDHQSLNCVKCHHTWDGKSAIKSCASTGCHDELKHKGEDNSYFKAFHTATSDRSCRGCHRKLNKEGKTDLQITPCANNICHVKK
ncbi:cytochrome c3 family protein [Maridesulfovibrio bastinii]|uniref:cytochrome c3 family protein n=1 Tax=Maridesulfovibrio bastinii TaxID=47157 RepID=UPI000412D39A|nr:cytochrome c3 family protein [Maridesulfovibrio bastinii]